MSKQYPLDAAAETLTPKQLLAQHPRTPQRLYHRPSTLQTLSASPPRRLCQTTRSFTRPSPSPTPIHLQSKPYRLVNYDADIKLRSNIATTLSPGQSKLYREIRELNCELNPEYIPGFEKMLEKLCIKTPRKKKGHWVDNVNVETVETMYVKDKSRQKQSEKEIKVMKSEIHKVSDPKILPKKYSFFQFTSDKIREWEERSPKRATPKGFSYYKGKSNQPRQHPIVEIYDTEFHDIIEKYKHGTLDVHTDLYDNNFNNSRFDQPDMRSEKLRRLQNLKSLKARIDFVSKSKSKNPKVKQPFAANLL